MKTALYKNNRQAKRDYSSTLEVMLDIDMLIKLAPASVATAFASIVLPVPGGPKSNIPLQGCQRTTHLAKETSSET